MNEQNEQRDELHEKLCAYVLGEATEAERTEVEAALEASPELRTERARLEATIGFVQTNLGEGSEAGLADQLSPAASAALLAAAEAKAAPRALPSVRHWYSSPMLKMAAGIGAVGLTWIVWTEVSREGEAGLFSRALEVAKAETEETSPFVYNVFGDESSPRSDRAQGEDQLKALGYLGDSEESALYALGYSGPASTSKKSEEFKQRGSKSDLAQAVEPAPVAEELLERLRTLGYTDDGVGGKTYREPADNAPLVRAERPSEADEVLGSDFDKNASLGAEVKLARSRPNLETERRAKDQLTLEDLEGLRPTHETYENARAASELASTAGTVVDSPVSPGASGPSRGVTPQLQQVAERQGGQAPKGGVASAPAPKPSIQAGAVLTGSDDFFLGHGNKEITGADFEGTVANSADAEPEVVVLRELGYLEDDGEERATESLRKLGYLDDDDRGGLVGGRLETEEAARGRLQRRLDFVLGSCQRRPNERPRDMFFRFWGDNPFQYTVIDGLSTFAVDVDTASYALARRYLADNTLPEKAQIRTEEFVNYFDADVPAPLEDTFAIATELAPSRFGEAGGDSWMLRVAVRGKDVTREERQPLTLTFVIDVSGSMKEDNRLELVKHALRLLMGELDGRDSIAIVAFSREARVILPMTSARNRSLIETALHQLQPDGGTNAEAGLLLGYELARSDLTRNSHNRVVLLSDGVANIGRTDQASLTAAVAQHTDSGIYLNTVGVGMGNHNDALLEQLADKGDGVCHYIDDEAEARRALVERFTGAFEPIARDVKIQVEFDPTQVQRYRLLGYENRAIADRDFRNDAIDAGEVNAGHQVVALYELSGMPAANADGPLATVRLRWKPPHLAGIASADTEVATEIEQAAHWGDAAGSFGATSAGYRRSVLVGQFAEFLRRSQHARVDSLDELLAEARKLAGEMQDPDVAEFAGLVERSRHLILAERARRDSLSRALESIRETCYLQAQLEDLNLLMGHDRLYELEDAVRQLQQRIRLLQDRVGATRFSLEQAELRVFELENARLAAKISDLLRALSVEKVKVRRR